MVNHRSDHMQCIRFVQFAQAYFGRGVIRGPLCTWHTLHQLIHDTPTFARTNAPGVYAFQLRLDPLVRALVPELERSVSVVLRRDSWELHGSPAVTTPELAILYDFLIAPSIPRAKFRLEARQSALHHAPWWQDVQALHTLFLHRHSEFWKEVFHKTHSASLRLCIQHPEWHNPDGVLPQGRATELFIRRSGQFASLRQWWTREESEVRVQAGVYPVFGRHGGLQLDAQWLDNPWLETVRTVIPGYTRRLGFPGIEGEWQSKGLSDITLFGLAGAIEHVLRCDHPGASVTVYQHEKPLLRMDQLWWNNTL